MNKLATDKQLAVLKALVEGCSIRSTERMVGVHRDTIMRLLCKVGEGCARLLNEKMRGLPCRRLQIDEVWTYIKKHGSRLSPEEKLNPEIGDRYIFVALDPDTKLVPLFLVGKRDTTSAVRFMTDLEPRLSDRIQLTTDGFFGYLVGVEDAFGCEIDFAQLIKTFRSNGESHRRYAPPEILEVSPKRVSGNPDPKRICTSHIEAQNLTMRMCLRRLTRLCTGYSKKLLNLQGAINLHFGWYNFGRVHSTIKCTPAMESGIENHIWEMEEILAWAN